MENNPADANARNAMARNLNPQGYLFIFIFKPLFMTN